MANSEMLELTSPQLYAELQKINKEVVKIASSVDKANTSFKGLKLPSQFRDSISQLNNVIKQSNALLRSQLQLQQQLANATNQTTTSINNSTTANINNERAERERIRTERERLRLTEDQRRAEERQARGTQLLGSAYLQLSRQQSAAARAVQDLIARGRTATQTQREYDAELRAAQREFNTLNQRVTAADRAVGRFNRNVGNYPTQAIAGLRDLVGAFGLVGGVTAFAMIAKDVFETTKQLQSLDFALKQVTGSQEEYSQSTVFLQRISEAYGIEIQGLTRSYTGFLAASQNAIDSGAITAKQIQEIFESVSKASGAMGLSVDQQQGAFLALQQMISKGNVQAEEIRGQLAERLPGAFGILAKSMGVTEVQLNKLLKDGKVLAAEVLPAFAKQLEIAYGVENLERVENIAAATNRLGNAWTELIRTFSESDGVISKTLTRLLNGISDVLKGFALVSGGERSRDDYKMANLRAVALESERKIYEELNEEIGKAATLEQARSNAEFHRERITQLEAERRALMANIEASKEARSGATTTVLGITVPNLPKIANLESTIRTQSRALEENAIELGKYQGALDAANEVLDLGTVANKNYNESLKSQKADIDYLRDVFELRKQNTENEIAANEEIMNDEEKNFDIRYKAAVDYYALKSNLLEAERDEQLRLNELEAASTTEQYKKAISEGQATAENLEQIEYRRFQRQEKIHKEYLGNKAALEIEDAKKLAGVLADIEDKRANNAISQQQLDNIRQLNMESGNLTASSSYAKFKELEDRKTEIVEQANEERIRIELRRTITQIEALTAEERASKVYEELKAKEIGLNKDLADAEADRLNKTKELTLELKRATDEYLNSFSDGIFGDMGLSALEQFFKTGEDGLTEFERRFKGAGDNIQKQFAVAFTSITEVAQQAFNVLAENSRYNTEATLAEIDMQQRLAERFALTEEAKQQIQDQADEKRREARRKQAEQEKELAIFNAIIDTAQGVVAALSQGPTGIPLAALIGALGAAQIALISSREIPQFKDGVRNFGGGLAVVGDGGRSEVVRTPDGGLFRTPNTDTLVNLPKGSDVFKSDMDFLRNSGTLLGGVPHIMGDRGITKEDLDAAFAKGLGGAATNVITIGKSGLTAYTINAGSKHALFNDKVTFKSKTFN